MARCLVLGANGFIGSHLVDSLVRQGHDVRAFDRFGTRQVNFNPSPKIEITPGDFLNRSDLGTALEGVEYVFHLVSTTTPATAENDPLIDIETNIRMSVELFEECQVKKIKKIIFASTGGAIYGDVGSDGPINEQVMPQPVSPYAIGKLTIEHYLRYFNRKYGMDTLTFRISNPYGERHSPVNRQGVIPIFLHHIAKAEPITILGDGSMVRDYLYVKDVADMVAATFIEAKQPLYNLGSGRGVSINELVEIIKKITGKELKFNRQPKPQTFVQSVVLDIGRFIDEFGLAPATPLEAGIEKTWQYVLEASGGATNAI
jgi:UDP-glucose 4-epimerase